MTPTIINAVVYIVIVIIAVLTGWWYQKHKSKELNSDDCQTIQVELYRQTIYLIGELKMEMDELRGALALAQSEAEALKAKNADLVSQLETANKVPEDVAAQANTLVATLAP